MIHDIALQQLPVRMVLDRAGRCISRTQYSTVQYSTVQYSTTYSSITIQHSAVEFDSSKFTPSLLSFPPLCFISIYVLGPAYPHSIRHLISSYPISYYLILSHLTSPHLTSPFIPSPGLGMVGNDGATHHGTFDLAYFGCVPDLVIMAPSDGKRTI